MSSIEADENFQINQFYRPPKRPAKWRRFAFGSWVVFLIVLLVGFGTALVYKTGFTFSQINVEKINALPLSENADPDSLITPEPRPDRINILLLGLRGEGDPNGGLLTDSIMLISIDKATNRVALISIPRDLYVRIPGEKYKEKINFAYARGFEKQGVAGALFLSKVAVSQVTGLYINHVVSVDHAAFADIIDTLGGVAIHLDKPFIEDQQWIQGGDLGLSDAFYIRTENATSSDGQPIQTQKWVFEVPAGNNVLDGITALYFVRARYSSSDFDRLRRQQLVLDSVKDKVLSLGILANPVKIYQLLSDFGKNIRTDMTFNEMRDLMARVPEVKSEQIFHKVFDTSAQGLLYATKNNAGAYILLPVGDDFSGIRDACENIF